MKYIQIFLIFLLLSTSLSPYSLEKGQASTIYVGDDTSNGPWDRSTHHHY